MLSKNIAIDIDKFVSTNVSNAAELAKCITNHVNFAREKGTDSLYWFNNGYEPGGEEVVAEMYHRMLEAIGRESSWKSKTLDEITKRIKAYPTPTLLDRPSLYKIVLKNGIYTLDEGFSSPDPNYLTSVKLPIVYDPKATCPSWKRFLHSLLPVDGGLEYLLDIMSICMVPYTDLHMYLILYGSGRNGKSTFLNALRLVIGAENISNIDLDRICSRNEFVSSELVGKLLNTAGDMTNIQQLDTASLKKLTGDDYIQVVPKFKKGFSYKPFARFIFSTNFIPATDDDSIGFRRRTFIVPFTQKFAVGKESPLDLLKDPEELSGLFNLLVDRLERIMEEGKIQPSPAVTSIVESWVDMPDYVEDWFKENIVEEEGYILEEEHLYDAVIRTMSVTGFHGRGHSHEQTIQFVKQIYPNVVYNSETKSYVGIKPLYDRDKILKAEEEFFGGLKG